ncbi:hypothetical protein CkaCkLH20_05266 [Colletotrichum karsti]|uniref:Uncharacterized protein n=1 Tax=Colletotrichum karsti TaxID=1095194 RepID=A0A9P6IE33_9PEZI|nr:uncharacterized protein CkaCkLH20_05266 [Colletotrichum karsti]KAF9877000.1 hypothetical protein CkaCkLH20_05266 [Colletotrichum karsti]
MATPGVDLDDVQMHIDDATIQLSTHRLTTPFPESVISITRTSSPNTSKEHPSSPEYTPRELAEQAKARQERQSAREMRWVARERANRSKSPVPMTPMRASTGGIEKRKSTGKWKSKATDSRLSSDLDRLLVGDSSASRALQGSQHPLRAILHSLPGFTYDTELDNVKFRKGQRVQLGIEDLMASGGRDVAKEWLEEFLLLTFEIKAKVLERYPMCRELDDVPLGYITMAKDVETFINKLPYDRAFKVRRTMERRLCQPYDMRKLVEWTIRARCRFLETKPKMVPGFGPFGQMSKEEGTDLEKRLWAAVDARGYAMPRAHDD